MSTHWSERSSGLMQWNIIKKVEIVYDINSLIKKNPANNSANN